jgi:mannose-1-phosphate guanylyltransferase
MCGGAGTRLWPSSREGRPKRVSNPAVFGRPVVIANSQYRFIVAEQLAEAGIAADILLDRAARSEGIDLWRL